MEKDGIDDDHGETSAEDLATVHHQMQAGPEDEGLAGDHAHPGDELHRHGEFIGEDFEDDEQISQPIRDDAEGRHEQGPKIASAIAFEGRETKHDQFEGIVPGDTDQTCEHRPLRKGVNYPLRIAGVADSGIVATHRDMLFFG